MLSKERIKEILLDNGFTERLQENGSKDLNPYVYTAIEALLKANVEATKHVWLNVQTGEFSNTWVPSELHFKVKDEELIEQTKEKDSHVWKLLVYDCPSDHEFVFYPRHRLR